MHLATRAGTGRCPWNDTSRHSIHGARSFTPGDDVLHPDLRRRTRARIDASDHAPAEGGRVIGLGTGTIATYGSKGDIYRFYDINPTVIAIANRDFTYLRDSEATIQTALGDARLSLEREAAQGFDLLAIDAFSSDSIPVHLLTTEAWPSTSST